MFNGHIVGDTCRRCVSSLWKEQLKFNAKTLMTSEFVKLVGKERERERREREREWERVRERFWKQNEKTFKSFAQLVKGLKLHVNIEIYF